jgi:hypothetical protein
VLAMASTHSVAMPITAAVERFGAGVAYMALTPCVFRSVRPS